MNVSVNNDVSAWMYGQIQNVKMQYNTKCTEASNNDLSTWRDVGKGLYDYRASGDFRVVAKKNGQDFSILAVYKHGEKGGKVKVCGQTAMNY